MERAAEGNAAGGVRGELEHHPEQDDAAALATELKALRELIPGADIWYVQQYGGHVSWQLHLRADSGQHLLESLLAAAKDAEAAG